jgi:hypothetical protein
MMKPNAGLANEVIERILKLSADAHVQRREVTEDSPAFHSLTGAIAAYGKVLTLLVAPHSERESSPQLVDEGEVPQSESDSDTASLGPFLIWLLKQSCASSPN